MYSLELKCMRTFPITLNRASKLHKTKSKLRIHMGIFFLWFFVEKILNEELEID